MKAAVAACTGLALFLLAGRWSIARITGSDSSFALIEPRFWLVLLIAAMAFAPIHRPLRALSTRALHGCVAVFAFLGYHVLTVAWAPDFAMASNKAYELMFVAAVVGAMIRLVQVLGADFVARTLWRALVVVFAVFAAVALLGSTGGSRLAVLGGGPNVFGRNMALLALFCVHMLLKGGLRPIPIAGLGIASALVLLTGSRGAMLACAVGTLVLLWVHRVKPTRLLWLVIGTALALAIFATFTDVGEAALAMFRERVIRLTFEREHDSGRSSIYDNAIMLGWTAPMYGDGLAGFAARGYFVYPHNIVLEAFAEGGFVGVGALAAMLWFPLRAIVQRRGGQHALELAAFAALLASAQFSGDFYDSRGVLLFGTLGLLRELADLRTPMGRDDTRPARALIPALAGAGARSNR
jgi:O-antigen ligase